MKKITRITTQKKRKNRFNIFLDTGQGEEYGFSVDEAVLIEYRLRKGMELDDDTISTLIQKDDLHKSYTLAINFLSYRMRTKKEIQDYLIKKEVDEEHIGVIMDKLDKEGLLNDKQFAEAFVRTRIQTANKGPMLVKQELSEKGVAASIANEAVQLFTYEVQFNKAQKLIEKKRKTNNRDSFRKQLQQLQATLMQKGFTQDVVKDVISEIQDEENPDQEWEALVNQGEKLLRKHQQKLSGYELRNKLKENLYRKGFQFDLINAYLEEALDEID